MRVLFIERLCPMCFIAERALHEANASLPSKYQIDMVDIYSGDPRTKILARYYGTKDPNKWKVPVLVVDVPTLKEDLNRVKRGSYRFFIHASYGYTHYKELIKSLFKKAERYKDV